MRPVEKVARALSTLFFVGHFPLFPGTIASLLGVFLYLAVKNNPLVYFSLTVILLILGFWSSSVAEKTFPRKDPGEIVIDEFSSMLLAYLFIPFSVKFMVIGFLLFRIFDITKIPPLKKLQTLPAGYGIMLDDIAAAILTNLILQVLRFVT